MRLVMFPRPFSDCRRSSTHNSLTSLMASTSTLSLQTGYTSESVQTMARREASTTPFSTAPRSTGSSSLQTFGLVKHQVYLRKVGMREAALILHIASTEPEFLDHTGIVCSRLESLSTAQVAGLSAR